MDENIFLKNNEKASDTHGVSPHGTGSTERYMNSTLSCTKCTDNIEKTTVRTSMTVLQSTIDDHVSTGTSVQNVPGCIPVPVQDHIEKKNLVRT